MTDARHEQAVTLLTGLERFVRLVVEREIPLSQANPANLTPSEKSPLVIGTPKPYTGLYSANSYMANRPGYSAFRRSIDADKILSPSPTSKTPPSSKTTETSATPPVNGIARMNGQVSDELKKSATTNPTPPPQPAPRQSINQQQQPTARPTTQPPAPPSATTSPTPTATPTPGAGEEKAMADAQEDIQVPKPITNEEFQAMIPAHFLRPPTNSSPSPDSSQKGSTVTVTIKQPDGLPGDVSFPPAPTTIGKVTETITKSTLTETVVTRVTDNQLVRPVIIEVCAAPLVLRNSFASFFIFVNMIFKDLMVLRVFQLKFCV